MKTDPKMIDIDDENRHDDRPVEVPVFSIESSEPHLEMPSRYVAEKGKRNLVYTLLFITLAIIIGIGLWIWSDRLRAMAPEVESSVSDKENIEILKQPFSASAKGTTVTSDSVLGVAFDMYSLHGLKASLETVMPDIKDSTLVLFMRSCDYHPDKSWIGPVVLEGNAFPRKEKGSRPGYVAISEKGKPTLGISLTDDVMDFTEDAKGTFFRQYVLLGGGELPPKFSLHGKVERAALGRMADGKLYYVVTSHRETMYDFADALREYGFMDAIYLTGGNGYTFYRDQNGKAHNEETVVKKYLKYQDSIPPAPLLVFRNR